MPIDSKAMAGCTFDSQTAKAVKGKDILLMILNATKDAPIAASGQQDLSWTIEMDTNDIDATKDIGGDWSTKLPGAKSWSASAGGMSSLDDEGHKAIVKAIVDGDPLCVGMYQRTKTETGYSYKPIRQGSAFATSDELEANADENMTYSVDFDGTGVCWTYETATAEEIENMTLTTTVAAG